MKVVILLFAALSLAACTTAFQRADGSWDVPRNVEVRSPLGTNAGFVKLEHCLTKNTNWYGASDYTDCHKQKDWVATQSQGQGGQIIGGGLAGLGFGLGSAFSGTSSSASAASSATANVATKGHGH